MTRIGLIAGSGVLPRLFAQEAQRRGLEVIAVAHEGETDPALETLVHGVEWVRVGQVQRMVRIFQRERVTRAVMAGGIGRVRAITGARPDWGALRIASRLRSFRDDALLRGVARYFEEAGVDIVAPTQYLERLLAPVGHLGGPAMTPQQRRDLDVGIEVASLLGRADVGQTAVVRDGLVLALEAIDGTDETIRRGGRLGGKGAVVVKLSKLHQDDRFDLPAVGPATLDVMAEVGASALAVEAGRSVVLDLPAMLSTAERHGICLEAVER